MPIRLIAYLLMGFVFCILFSLWRLNSGLQFGLCLFAYVLGALLGFLVVRLRFVRDCIERDELNISSKSIARNITLNIKAGAVLTSLFAGALMSGLLWCFGWDFDQVPVLFAACSAGVIFLWFAF